MGERGKALAQRQDAATRFGATMQSKRTIEEVAQLSGTSPSTVSRVLTGRARVSAGRRAAVLAAIDETGYRPDMLARALRTGVTHTLGLLVNDVLNPFYGAIAKSVEAAALTAGYTVMLCNTGDDRVKEIKYLRLLRDKAVDGIIFAPTPQDAAGLEQILDLGIPLVQFDRHVPALSASAVLIDNEGASYELARHLVAQGCRRIVLVSGHADVLPLMERERGYQRALAEAGLQQDNVCRVVLGPDGTSPDLEALLDRAHCPDAVIAANYRFAVGVLRAARSVGLRVGHELAVAAFDDIELFELFDPPITAVAQPSNKLGQMAVDLLIAQIRSPKLPPQVVTLPVEMTVRESTLRSGCRPPLARS